VLPASAELTSSGRELAAPTHDITACGGAADEVLSCVTRLCSSAAMTSVLGGCDLSRTRSCPSSTSMVGEDYASMEWQTRSKVRNVT
jgi:hypothetical protein